MHRSGDLAIFCSQLVDYGGAERLTFEEARALGSDGSPVPIVTLNFDERSRFRGAYDSAVEVLVGGWSRSGKISRFIGAELALIKWLRRARPRGVVALSAGDCALLWIPALLTRTPYITHINGTIFWFPTDRTKYALVHRTGLAHVLAASPFSGDFVTPHPGPMTVVQRLKAEASALLHWFAVRAAVDRITFSRRMAWEVSQFYGVNARELKGAFPRWLLSYVPRSDPLDRFRVMGGPVILNVNRLESRKRVDLAIRAFAEVARRRPDVTLVVGGLGPERSNLEALVSDMGMGGRVHFAGFIPEDELPEWLAACEVFVHMNWAEFAIAPYEALALGKKVVWSTEMERDPVVDATGLVHAADPLVGPIAEKLEEALQAPNAGRSVRASLEPYSWETYFTRLREIVARSMAA